MSEEERLHDKRRRLDAWQARRRQQFRAAEQVRFAVPRAAREQRRSEAEAAERERLAGLAPGGAPRQREAERRTQPEE